MSDAEEPIEQVLEHGMEALMERLGIAGAIRFLQAIGMARGDYTAERRQRIEKGEMDDIVAEARARYEAHEE